MKLENKVAVITGGAMGIGRGIVEVFLKYGASVIILDYSEELKNTVEQKKWMDSITGFEQVKDKEYILRFQGKLGEALRYTGQILAVGIGYDRKTKKHSCKVEILR